MLVKDVDVHDGIGTSRLAWHGLIAVNDGGVVWIILSRMGLLLWTLEITYLAIFGVTVIFVRLWGLSCRYVGYVFD